MEDRRRLDVEHRSYDPDTNTLFWGTSNPWPDYNDDIRAGDNLYSCSVLALDPDTGKLKWYYQFTPHDLHDWDATQNPVLVDTEFLGQTRKVLAWPNRNGFFYLIDRTNGKFLSAKAFVKQTWNDGFDFENNGRPKVSARHRSDAGRQRQGVARHRRRRELDVAQLQSADEACLRVRARGTKGVHEERSATSHDRPANARAARRDRWAGPRRVRRLPCRRN